MPGSLRLKTFGGLTIEAGPEGPTATPRSPRGLAVLSLVAASGSAGISREKIIGILWSETSEDQARHTLSQNLYVLRRETGQDCITGTSQLRLDPSVTSDVTEFRDALSAGDLARAVSVYDGPFLDGFYLPGAPEFERWVDEERGRLQTASLKALETLASRAAAGPLADAVGWWRRLCEMDGFSAKYAAGLIRELVAGGDTAAAIQFAREYEARVRQELDADIEPSIRQLIASVRQASAPIEVVPAGLPPAAPAPAHLPASQSLTPTVETPPPSEPAITRSRLRLGALIALGGLTLLLGWQLGRPAARRPPPFLAVGTILTRDTMALGPVLRDMLATNLARITGIQVLANSRLLEMLPRGTDSIPRAATDAARRAGANEILEGELGVVPDGLILTLRRVSLESGVVRQGYTVRAADRYALVDSATAAIARDFRLEAPSDAVASVRTASPTAYALYEEGLRSMIRGEHQAAYRLLTTALQHDSTFAMAAHYAWLVSKDWIDPAEADRTLELAERLASRSTEPEQLLIRAGAANGRAPITEFLEITKEFARRYPRDPDGQLLLGMAHSMNGEWAAAVSAYEQAIHIDSGGVTAVSIRRLSNALTALSDAYAWWDSVGASERSVRRLIAVQPEQASAWGNLVEPLLRQNRWGEAHATIARAQKAAVSLTDFSFYLDRAMVRSGRYAELDYKLIAELRRSPMTNAGQNGWLLLFSLRNQGRLREAQDLAEHGVVPGASVRVPGPPSLASLAIVAFERGEARKAAQHFFQASTEVQSERLLGVRSRNVTWQLTLAATALAAAGDTAEVRRLADSVERTGKTSSFGRDPRIHHFLRGLLFQHQGRHADAVEAFQRSVFSLTSGYTRINFEMARSLISLGRYAEAVAVLRPALRGTVDGSNSYMTFTELHELIAQAFDQAGIADSAAAHYAEVESAWRGADPEFRSRYETARAKSSSRPARALMSR